MINRDSWLPHPIFLVAFSFVALCLILFLYIYWYLEVNTWIETFVTNFQLDPVEVLVYQTWVVLLVGSFLVMATLAGVFLIFAYYHKTLQLYRLQNNFINNFTHELKTPVTSLKLYLQTFLMHELSKKDQHKFINYMITDVGRLTDNVNNILNLARLESKSYEGEFVEIEFSGFIEEFLKKNEQLFSKCIVQVHNPSEKSFYLMVNILLFDMLLMNLFTNAMKYNKSPVCKIDIFLEMKKRTLVFRFRDNGMGLQRKELKKIFRKFYQVGKSDDMSAKGSGLGLYIIQNIVRIHKWKIKAKSDGLGKGTEFVSGIPLFAVSEGSKTASGSTASG